MHRQGRGLRHAEPAEGGLLLQLAAACCAVARRCRRVLRQHPRGRARHASRQENGDFYHECLWSLCTRYLSHLFQPARSAGMHAFFEHVMMVHVLPMSCSLYVGDTHRYSRVHVYVHDLHDPKKKEKCYACEFLPSYGKAEVMRAWLAY